MARECGLAEAIDSLFAGELINETEQRAVLHTALRNLSNEPVRVDGEDVMPEVSAVLRQMEAFSDELLTGAWRGYTDKPITDIE